MTHRFDVFVSYHTADRPEAAYVVDRLRSEGLTVWFDRDELVAGTPLIAALEGGLAASRDICVLVGRDGVGSWQLPEVDVAISHGLDSSEKKLIPILLPGCAEYLENPGFLSRYAAVDFRSSLTNADEWVRLIRALQGDSSALRTLERSHGDHADTLSTGIRRAASLALVRGDSVLLVRRASTQRTGPNLWQLPGGKVDRLEDPKSAAVREIREELGIAVRPADVAAITEIADVWLDKRTGEALHMSLFTSEIDRDPSRLSSDLDRYEWIPLRDTFRHDFPLFGVTARMLRLVRRFYLLYQPLSRVADLLERDESGEALGKGVPHLTQSESDLVLMMLSLFGFVSDERSYTASSVLSAPIVRSLSEWARTEGQVFEAQGDSNWYDEAVLRGDAKEIKRYQKEVFRQHRAFLGLVSHRLARALSTRRVCDVLLFARLAEDSTPLVLARWDFLGRKFQIPSKGLEVLDLVRPDDERAARFIVQTRFGENSVDDFLYQFISSFETAHVSAGSLDDGPLMRRYIVSVFRLALKADSEERILTLLSDSNRKTSRSLRHRPGDIPLAQRRSLMYFVWIELELLLARPQRICGEKVQGFNELLDNIGHSWCADTDSPLLIDSGSAVPIIRNNRNAKEAWHWILER